MNLLLDAKMILWWLADDPALPATAQAAIADGANTVYLSTVAVWIILQKQNMGKIELPDDFIAVLKAQPFTPLAITIDHILMAEELQWHHHDLTERLLVAQTKVENLTLVTVDPGFFQKYAISVLGL